MDCQICAEDLGDKAYCLPCGHIYCVKCINRLPLRNRSIECPFCRQVVSSRIGPENIRKIFLNTSSFQARLEVVEKERDNALRDIGRITSVKIDPYLQALNTKDTLLEIRNKEVEQLKAELAKVKDVVNTVLPEKERQIREMTKSLSHLAKEHHEEVSQHWKARGELRAQDAEITKLKEAVASFSPQAQTGIWNGLSNFLYEIKGALSIGLTSPPPIKTEFASAFGRKNTQTISNPFFSSSLHLPSTPTSTSSSIFSSNPFLVDSSPTTDPDRTLIGVPDSKEFSFRFSPERRSLFSSRSDSLESLAGPAFSQVKSQTTSLSHSSSQKAATQITQVTQVKPKQPKERALKRGDEIQWSRTGYGRPQNTAVPECTATDGCHVFSGKGTNQYATKYTCTICYFSCSESRRR